MRYDDRLGWKRAGECIVGSVTEYGPLISVALTDENGAFALNTSECDDFGDLASDTLAVAVVLPDTVLMGAPFRVNSGQRIEAEVTVDEGGSLCDDNEYTFVDGYIYRFPPRTITIP
jgi:hypothetical protein